MKLLPALLTVRSLKVATPLTGLIEVVPRSFAPLGLLPSAADTGSVACVATLPNSIQHAAVTAGLMAAPGDDVARLAG